LKPQEVFEAPQWQLAILIRHLPALEAAETQRLILAATFAHLPKEERRRVSRRLEAQTSGLYPEPAPVEVIEHDPVKAAEWFRALGVEVIASD
jgi:hypothetical protein